MTGETDQLQVAPVEDAEGLHLPLSGSWRYRTGASLSQLPRFPDRPGFHQNVATALSNGMLAAIIPFGIRGAIWYQGESNRTRGKQYERLFPAMIADWRARWGRGDFPFYFVQIAPFGYGGDTGQAAELRDAQRKTLAVPNTGMAVTMDIGDPGNIHPVDKLDVGERLARWALAKTYGKQDLVYSGPLYRSMSFEGDAIRVEFDHVDGGLVARGGELTHFTIAGADRRFVPAAARIDGRGVLVSSPEVPRPVAVRYGWGAADQPNLFNAAGLPASSFRTDDWPTVGR
jgi:sialate O-acetylesterase